MSNNITRELKLSLPLNSFYGNGNVKPTNNITFNSFAIPKNSTSAGKTSRTSRTTLKQSSSRTNVKEIFMKQFKPVSNQNKMEVSRMRSNRSTSPDWATCRFSLPAVKKIKEHGNRQRKHRSISKKKNEEEPKKNNRHRSVSPDWNTSRFSLPPKKKKTSPLVASQNSRSSSSSKRNTSRLPLLKTPVKTLKSHKTIASVSPGITAPLARHRLKTKINKNTIYTISQKTLDNLLPKPEIHLFDVVKYGPTPPHKEDFLFGLNLMRSEVLNKIDLLHYKKKLRNTGINFIRTFQQPKKSKSKTQKSDVLKIVEEQIEPIVSIEILNQPDAIIIKDDVGATKEVDKPEEIIQIDDDDEVDRESEELSEEAIQNFADKFGGDIIEETTEKSNVIDSNIDNFVLTNINGNANNSAKETVKFFETNTFYHSITKKRNTNSLDSKTDSKTSKHNHKRNSLPNTKKVKKNVVSKKKSSLNKKKNIIRVKWPIARKSLLDLRNNS